MSYVATVSTGDLLGTYWRPREPSDSTIIYEVAQVHESAGKVVLDDIAYDTTTLQKGRVISMSDLVEHFERVLPRRG